MKLYKIVKYCRLCKKRFFSQNARVDEAYCAECYKRIKKED